MKRHFLTNSWKLPYNLVNIFNCWFDSENVRNFLERNNFSWVRISYKELAFIKNLNSCYSIKIRYCSIEYQTIKNLPKALSDCLKASKSCLLIRFSLWTSVSRFGLAWVLRSRLPFASTIVWPLIQVKLFPIALHLVLLQPIKICSAWNILLRIPQHEKWPKNSVIELEQITFQNFFGIIRFLEYLGPENR